MVIGCVSLDVLRHERSSGTVKSETVGGAGLYTALAAAVAGAEVTLCAPKPTVLDHALLPLDQMVTWIGPGIGAEQIPSLDIVHHGQGRATLLSASWGAESQLTTDSLPSNLESFDIVHIAALSSARRQLDFFEFLKKKGAQQISVGTYARIVQSERETVLQLSEQADLFFMNENEANGLYGSLELAPPKSGRLLFITRGDQGAVIVNGPTHQHINAHVVTEVDPTGAGDTFCGAALACLAQGSTAVQAAETATALAARCVEHVGPNGLLTLLGKVEHVGPDGLR